MPRKTAFEPKTRVSFFVPAKTKAEQKAYFDVVKYLESQRPASPRRGSGRKPRKQISTKRKAITGYTKSRFPNSEFTGKWWSSRKRSWVEDRVVMFIVDMDAPLDDLDRTIRALLNAISRSYRDQKCPQVEHWVVAHEASRCIESS